MYIWNNIGKPILIFFFIAIFFPSLIQLRVGFVFLDATEPSQGDWVTRCHPDPTISALPERSLNAFLYLWGNCLHELDPGRRTGDKKIR